MVVYSWSGKRYVPDEFIMLKPKANGFAIIKSNKTISQILYVIPT